MRDFLIIIGVFFLLLAIFMLIFYALLPVVGKVIDKLGPFVSKICDKAGKIEFGYFKQIMDGTIYKKEILPEEFNYHNYIPMRYRIHIKRKVNNSIFYFYYDVSEITYSMYSIGDWFDIQNLRECGNRVMGAVGSEYT